MGVYYGSSPSWVSKNRLVTSNLILNLDAANATSYPGSGTTWYDLSSGARNSTMTNITYDSSGYMTFNGTSSVLSAPVPAPSSMPITFEFWINPDTSTPGGLYDTARNQQNVLRQYDDVNVNGRAEWWNKDPTISLGLSATTWQQIVIVYSFTTVRTITYYKNGVLQSTTTGSVTSTFAWLNPIYIGNINSGAPWYAGKIATIRIYNSDIGQSGATGNFNALRGRFGL